MLLLDKKSYGLVNYLLALEEPETVMTIAKALNQSRRKIYYHLDKINEALPKEVDQIIAYPRVGIVLTATQKDACRLLLEGMDDYSYVMSIEERQMLMMSYIAASLDRVTIEKLMTLTGVSRNTVLNDLNEIRRQLSLEQYQIKLLSTKSCGYYFDTHPLSKFQFFYKLLDDLERLTSQHFMTIFQDKMENYLELSLHVPQHVMSYIDDFLKKSRKQLGKTLNYQDSQLFLKRFPYLLLCYRNTYLTATEKGQLEQDFQRIAHRKEYSLAIDLATGLKNDCDFPLDEGEIGLIAMLLLAYRKDRDAHLESRDYDEMRSDIEGFISQLKVRFHLEFTHEKELINQLLRHCKALVYRKTYGIFSTNPLTEHIQDKYAELFAMTQVCAEMLEKAWGITLTPDDIAYLTVHLGGELRRHHNERKNCRIILVCDEGIAIQKLLLKQCQTYLPLHHIEAVFTSEQFHSVRDLITSDVVVTTTDAIESPVPSLVINPILSESDLIRLIRFVKHKGRDVEQDIRTSIDQSIRHYVKDDSEAYLLRSQIEKVLNQEFLLDIIV